MRRKLTLALSAILLAVLLIEGLARIWVASRWPDAKLHEMTHATETRGRFRSDPALGYTLTPGFSFDGKTHDSRGFRGYEREDAAPPATVRIVLMGASTVYGIWVNDDETAAARLEKTLREDGHAVEVINAGVPGWTSLETRQSLEARVLPLEPDIVVIMDGRNDAFPQLFRGYRPDYGHYRRLGYEFRNSNLAFKRVFRISHAAMLIVTRGELFGFSERAENPAYGGILLENRPSFEEAESFAKEPERFGTFGTNLREAAAAIRAAGAKPVLATVPFLPDLFRSGVLTKDPYLPPIRACVQGNIETVRRLAAELDLPLVDTAPLVTLDLLKDDCHFTAEGEARLADLYARTLAPLIRPEDD